MGKKGSLRERLEKQKLKSQDGVVENDTTNEVEVIEIFDGSDDEDNNSLSEKQQEVETILAQVKQTLNGNYLTDIQKAKLATAANKLNKTRQEGDIAAIEVSITEVKAAMNVTLSTKRTEADTLIAQANKALQGKKLNATKNITRKTVLEHALANLKSARNGGDVAAIDKAIQEIKKALPKNNGCLKFFLWIITLNIIITLIVPVLKNSDAISNWFNDLFETNKAEQYTNFIGSWRGEFNNKNVTLNFISINNGNVDAQITFPNNQTEKLNGTINGNQIYLKDVTNNNFYDGEYNGTFNTDTTVYTGTYTNRESRTTLIFRFEKGKEIKKEDLVGDWKGVYTSGNYGNKFYITLHINPDMSGIEEISRNGNTGKCSISVDYSNGTVKITEKVWTKAVNFWALGYLQGELVDGKLKGKACGRYKSYDNADGVLLLEKVITTPSSTPKPKPQNTDNQQNTLSEQQIKQAEAQRQREIEAQREQEKQKKSEEVNNTLMQAITAFSSGKYNVAFSLYVEAANKSANSTNIKREAAQNFKNKAQALINALGECDKTAKTLLLYAKDLYPSSEINTLLNLCN
ncbi:hypothetical protein FACS189437_06940 [Bacteroidia bacterium]|nr:hypothetical protein FACS189437_06940 [Bacteroidia bacterium]